MTEPITAAEVRRRTHEEWQALERVVAALSPAELATPGVEDGWTVKDVLAHILWWQQRTAQLLSKALELPAPRLSVPTFDQQVPRDAPGGWLDTVNQHVYDQYKDLPLAEVQRQLAESFRDVTALLDRLSDDDLQDDSQLSSKLPAPAAELIASDTHEHYREHRLAIEHWSAQQGL